MTRIDFYILESADASAMLRIASRLADKAFRLGHRVYAHVADADSARRLDEMLWTFQAGSFVPHAQVADLPACYADDPAGATGLPPPVLIGNGPEPPDDHWDLLVNLSPEVPLFFSRYRRLAEVVGGDAGQREAGRARYRFYRDRGYELHTHHL